MFYYEVAPLKIVRTDAAFFTYASSSQLSIGQLVTIPLGTRTQTGIVLSQTTKPSFDVKPITEALAITPLPQPLIATALWMSDYYATHLATVFQTVLPRGLTKTRRHRADTQHAPTRNRTTIVFNTDQESALATLRIMEPGTALLHGVTGSGKTTIYIEMARETIALGQSVIVLVPEIALTSQLVDEFQTLFGDVIVTHSRQTEAERHIAWEVALNASRPRIVIGPRSALFMPLRHVGLIVIDECHEPSYKQEQSPRYSALVTAATLSQHHNAKLILGSATPNVTDYYRASTADRPIIELPKRARHDAIAPSITLVDMTKRGNFTNHRFLSDALIGSITQTLASGEQVLIYHNRRGTASTTLCENCGWQAGCPRCFVPLTLHADTHQLACHICGYTAPVPTSCPECGHVDIIHKGIGTKLIESEVRRLFPQAAIARFDGDTPDHESVDRRYAELYDGSIQIIIGTQVIAKGLDLPHLRTVGVVQADSGLSLPDYTAPERTFQLLAQVIGRVGRSHHATSVIVQSYQPDNPAVRDGIAQNYADFYDRTVALRNHTNFPPFCYLLKLTCIYKTEAAAIRNAQKVAAQLRRDFPDVEILGPTPSFYERVRDTYRWQLTVKSARRARLLDITATLPATHWQFELDPLSLL